MSTAHQDSDLPRLPLTGASPAQVRAALWPEFRADFELAYQESLAEAGRTLDLTCIHDTVEHWRRRSWVTRDPTEHRRLVRRAAELIEDQRPPADEPVEATEARL